jgi:TonB-dependent SusC/RagA subfamily outer membrane receptor
MMRSITFIALFIVITASSFGQTRVVHGVLTAYNKYPVANIKVTAKKSKSTTVSDSLGNFSIVCNEKDQVQLKPETFKTVSRKIDKYTPDTLRINLVFMDSKKNREIAIGYGYMAKEDLTFAADHMQQENNEYCNFTNIYELLKGKFPGVQVDGASGSYKVYIRNATSINGPRDVLFVVDGSAGASIDGLSPCDIRSIDVIKDGMTSMYGTRGSNGVILIDTKRGN